MEEELKAVLASLGACDEAFRQQVERMQKFKDRMKAAGVEMRQNKFRISLTEGLRPPVNRVLTH
jgi:hypothetical protein